MAGDAGLAAPGTAGPGAHLAELKRTHQAEIEELNRLNLVGAHASRELLARLLRARLMETSLTARTPSELAVLARAIKTLPEWVWEGEVRPDSGTVANSGTGAATGGRGSDASGPDDRLNRAAGRRLEKQQQRG
jgi:hypothetical protein